jgi:hypothetical protein
MRLLALLFLLTHTFCSIAIGAQNPCGSLTFSRAFRSRDPRFYHPQIPTMVMNLRKSFKAIDPQFSAIKNLGRRQGYRWIDEASE